MLMKNFQNYDVQMIYKGIEMKFFAGETKEVPDIFRGSHGDTLIEIIQEKIEVKQDVVIKTPTNKGKVQCEALTKKGTRCKQKALKGKTFCPTHSKKNK